ncbi:MAG TPA: hypothetical protein VGF67_30480 [Ktedonobacteraceae bacterium]
MPKPPPVGPFPYTPGIEIYSPKNGVIFSLTDTITVTGLAFLTCEGGDCIGNVNLRESSVEVTFGDPATHSAQLATLGKPDNPAANGTESSIRWTFTAPLPPDAAGQMQITAAFHYKEGGRKRPPPVYAQVIVQIGGSGGLSPFITTYSYYDQSVIDWTDPGPHSSPLLYASPYEHTGHFYSATRSFAGTDITHQWLGVGKAFSVVRNGAEYLVVLSSNQFLNQEQIIEAIRNVLERNPRASLRGKLLTSYAYGGAIQGPGGDRGGLSTVPQQFQDRLLLTINIPFHINTPAEVAAVNGYIVYYASIFFQEGHALATVLGVAHPWAFESGYAGAGQDEINKELDDGVTGTEGEIEALLNKLLADLRDTIRAQTQLDILDGYLLPGIVTEQGTSPATGDASTDITLALILGTL